MNSKSHNLYNHLNMKIIIRQSQILCILHMKKV